ncbi:nitrilase-related carbon-nitrogen hydrolase [Luteolibacter sp. LG18]|uniref:apolipoprotein N-acyltransferase n=1 Tax=Luteolibacter sp. LG18 TaxID=2819286 RepID=UPI002B2945EF|nr:apolipoprotein N-acyltransferase [Luteolibacter sp. LG18]
MNTKLRYLLAFLSGGIAVFAFPPFSWKVLVLVVWPLLFVALRGAGFKTGTRLGVVHGLVLYAIGLSWFWHIFSAISIALWLMLALFTGLAGGLIGWVSLRHRGARWLPLYAAAVWTGIEYFRSEWFYLRFPWMTPGLALGPSWLSPWIGVYGAGFVVVLVAAWWALGKAPWRCLGFAVLGLLMSPFPTTVYEAGKEVPVLTVQNENNDFVSYHDASRTSGFQDGVILWPEYSTPYEVRPEQAEWAKLKSLAADARSVVVFGTVKPLAAAKHYNVARTMDESGELGWHAKNRPVHLMDDGEPGKTAVPVKTRFGHLGTPICFDCDYTEVVRRMTVAGAEGFVVPSMDAASWSAREHLQHAELFRHRAAENARWFAIASTSGMTQFIDPRGRRVKSLPLMEPGILRGSIWLRDDRTFFNRAGWVFPWIVSGAAVIGTAALIFMGRKRRVVSSVEVFPPDAVLEGDAKR